MRVSLGDLDLRVQAAAEWAVAVARAYGVPVTITSVRRSRRKQAALRRAWEEGRSPWPANRPGESAHEWGLAWDSVVPSWATAWWAHVRRIAGFRVPAGDIIHAEAPEWRRWR